MPGLTDNAARELVETLGDVMRAVRRKARRRGSRLSVLADRLAAAFPADQLFKVMDEVGLALGRQTDNVLLAVDPHAAVRASVVDINQGAKAWLAAFHGPMQGRTITTSVVREIEQLTADFLLESHHVVESRVRSIYAQQLKAYWKPGTSEVDPQRMITIAIPAALHRGARYAPIEAKTARLAALRDTLPDQLFNLTDALLKRFPDSYLKSTPFPTYLRELAEFYRTNLPGLYPKVTLPDGRSGGLLEALQRIAQDTNCPPIPWP